ncbi:bicaudal C-like protein 1 [Heterocephalus glaber]|uniref:Bicaudal C-like protein 1 n=1 Tax=Heterocephalus glaber TaxID=10181 RepID=G5BR29_HETGA|nr:bicaudal C-like protein 1 [Heterocephalus glaber]
MQSLRTARPPWSPRMGLATQRHSPTGLLQRVQHHSPMPGSEDDLGAGAPLHSPEWSEEYFRVDRKKLEAVLQAADQGKGRSGEDFFQKIMEETNTQIAWPSKLNIGAKSKKDPHIKVS